MLNSKDYKKTSGLIFMLNHLIKNEKDKNLVNQAKLIINNYEKINYENRIQYLIDEMNKIYTICPICGFKHCYFDKKCSQDTMIRKGGSKYESIKDYNNLNEYELKHYNFRNDNLLRSTLATSIGLMLRNNNLNDKIREKLLKIKPTDKSKTYQEWIDEFNSIYTICSICGEKIYIYEENCKNSAIIPDSSPNHWHEKPDKECNEKELKHKFFRIDQLKKEALPKAIKNKLNIPNILPESRKILENFDCYNTNKTYDQLKDELGKIILYNCEICGEPVYFWYNNCKYLGILKQNEIENNFSNAKFIDKPDKQCNKFELIHKKYRNDIKSKIMKEICSLLFYEQYCPKCNKITTFSISLGGCMSCYNKSDKMRKASSERIQARLDDQEQAGIMLAHLLKINAEQGLEQKLNNLQKGNKTQKILYETDPEWKAKKDQRMKNMRDKVAWLWKNDPEWAKKMLKICIENLAKARDIKIEIIRNKVNSQNFTFNGIKIDYDNINNIKKNDICGAYVIN